MNEPIDDVECMASTLDLVSAIADKDTMNARTTAWATGDLEALAGLSPLPDPDLPCGAALLESSVTREVIPGDIGGRIDALWLEHAERSLAQNVSTFAVLPLAQLTTPDGYMARLRNKGYTIQPPGEYTPTAPLEESSALPEAPGQ